MKQVSKFYLKQAVYQVEVGGREAVLLMNYSGNTYEVVGYKSGVVEQIAQALLSKKHGINFAYKFASLGGSRNDKIDQEQI
jgi:hypothetical protein